MRESGQSAGLSICRGGCHTDVLGGCHIVTLMSWEGVACDTLLDSDLRWTLVKYLGSTGIWRRGH